MKLGLVANTLPPVIQMAHYSSIELQDACFFEEYQGDADMPLSTAPISEINCNTLKIWIEYLHQLENESL